jgi:hypothetical protein
MKKSLLNIVTQLNEKLIEYPTIVNLLEQKDFNFVATLYAWMKATEEVLKNNGLSETAELAGLRSKILATRFNDEQRTSAKKQQTKVAAEILYEVQANVVKIIKPYEARIEECRELISHLLNIVSQSEAMKFNPQTDDFQIFLNNLWNLFISHQQLKPGAVKLQSYLSHHDILRIMAEEINLADWQSPSYPVVEKTTEKQVLTRETTSRTTNKK